MKGRCCCWVGCCGSCRMPRNDESQASQKWEEEHGCSFYFLFLFWEDRPRKKGQTQGRCGWVMVACRKPDFVWGGQGTKEGRGEEGKNEGRWCYVVLSSSGANGNTTQREPVVVPGEPGEVRAAVSIKEGAIKRNRRDTEARGPREGRRERGQKYRKEHPRSGKNVFTSTQALKARL